MSGNSKKLIAFNYFGGKFTWVDQIYPYFPEHVHFVDVFCGSLAVTLNKPFSQIDTANDINSEVVNFFRVLRDQPEELIFLLKLTPVSREEYNNCWQGSSDIEITDLEKARRFFVRVRQSFYGLGIQRKNKGWHLAKTVNRCKKAETVSKWYNGIDKLYAIMDRLLNIQFEHQCYSELIPKIDFPGAFFFLDPPYPEESRSSKNDYKYDFKDSDHEDLANLSHSIDGKAMICSYDCDIMNDLYHDWIKITFPVKLNNIRSKKVQECIWMNYDPPAVQTSLFE